jgi:hypothetical protein
VALAVQHCRALTRLEKHLFHADALFERCICFDQRPQPSTMAQGRVIALLLIAALAYAATAADVAAAPESTQVVPSSNMRKLLVKISGETSFWTGGEEVRWSKT